jgi:hypothetical protein
MAYRFQLTEPVSEGFRRIADEQIKQAQKALTAGDDPAAGVHEGRKCMKRVRALLRLVRYGIGDKAFRRENRRFRDIAARVSGTRDAQVMVETLGHLFPGGQDAPPSPPKLTELLAARVTDAHGNGHTETTAELAAHLKAARRALAKLEITDDFAVLEQGLARVYRDCGAAYHDAYAEGTDHAFHEWRKTIQQHWRQMRLLQAAWPALMDVRADAAKELSELLGADHDLAVLAHFIETELAAMIPKREVQSVLKLVEARKADLRAKAHPLGARLLAQGETSLVRQVRRSWDAAPAIEKQRSPA